MWDSFFFVYRSIRMLPVRLVWFFYPPTVEWRSGLVIRHSLASLQFLFFDNSVSTLCLGVADTRPYELSRFFVAPKAAILDRSTPAFFTIHIPYARWMQKTDLYEFLVLQYTRACLKESLKWGLFTYDPF